MLVCYAVDFVILTPQGPQAEQVTFFGELGEVLKDLEVIEKSHSQAMIVHANDPMAFATSKAKLQVVRQLMKHDLTKIPEYPAFGSGVAGVVDKDTGIKFQVRICVSRRGELPPNTQPPSNILIAGS